MSSLIGKPCVKLAILAAIAVSVMAESTLRLLQDAAHLKIKILNSKFIKKS